MKYIFLILLSLFLISCSAAESESKEKEKKEEYINPVYPYKLENNYFTTDDSVNIYYKYYDIYSDKTITLIHGKDDVMDIWGFLIDILISKGFNVLTLDLRGYGNSISYANSEDVVDYYYFSDDDYRKMPKDVLQLVDYLKTEKEFSLNYYVGLNLGANIISYIEKKDYSKHFVFISPLSTFSPLPMEEISHYDNSLYYYFIYSQMDNVNENFSDNVTKSSNINFETYITYQNGLDILLEKAEVIEKILIFFQAK